jgi:hypothetical protein
MMARPETILQMSRPTVTWRLTDRGVLVLRAVQFVGFIAATGERPRLIQAALSSLRPRGVEVGVGR